LSLLHETKRAARETAMAVRAAARGVNAGAARLAAGLALEEIARLRPGSTVSGYLPIRSEIDPMPLMLALAGLGYRLCVPVIEGRGRPLSFREWSASAEIVRGPFGVAVPVGGATLVPDLLIVPMLAFDRRGHRLGYGGGFYDRTIAGLRAQGPVQALGFAYAAQEVPLVPDSETDMRLDAIVTEAGKIRPA
jgi:5-formyltetrahydrofolate cyclo-ligase